MNIPNNVKEVYAMHVILASLGLKDINIMVGDDLIILVRQGECEAALGVEKFKTPLVEAPEFIKAWQSFCAVMPTFSINKLKDIVEKASTRREFSRITAELTSRGIQWRTKPEGPSLADYEIETPLVVEAI